MARWLVNILKEVGTDAAAGSTRAAATTWAMARGVTMETIMKAADWTCARTMRAHYLRLLPREALDSVVSVQDAIIS